MTDSTPTLATSDDIDSMKRIYKILGLAVSQPPPGSNGSPFTHTIPTDAPHPAPPPITWDSNGLMRGVTYTYRSDNAIDWRAMIPREFLVIKRENEASIMRAQGVATSDLIDSSKVPDHQMQVLLGGWKRLLFLRGYTSLTNPCTFVTPEKAVATCTITFAPNYETRGLPVTYSWTASASLHNTSGEIPQMFLEATACNRAFSLCLRGFLNIGIVGKDEMGPARRGAGEEVVKAVLATQTVVDTASAESIEPPKAGYQPKDTLSKKCAEVGITFEKLKEGASTRYRAEMQSEPANWTSIDDVPSLDAWTLIDKLSKAKVAAAPRKA